MSNPETPKRSEKIVAPKSEQEGEKRDKEKEEEATRRVLKNLTRFVFKCFQFHAERRK